MRSDRRKVERCETRTTFTLHFTSGLQERGSCTVRHVRHYRFLSDEWVPGSHDVDVICDQDRPFGTVGEPARITVAGGYDLVGCASWVVYPTTRRLLKYGGD